MITKLRIYETAQTDPHRNLATEKHLMDITQPGECLLYLWQNKNTVVIGKNQNPWLECRTSLLDEEGGVLARRLSGGGAVFHDLGNLNFTFIMCKEDYDLDKQLSVIQSACALAGIATEKSGRNDVLADGRKFSGNAFYQNRTHAYHHGTLMVDVDKDKLGRYLSPPKAKLEAKGVTSVRSRVVNLKEICPQLSVEQMKISMMEAFAMVYGKSIQILTPSALDTAAIEALRARNATWEWNCGKKLPFSMTVEGRFSWGGVEIGLDVEGGIVKNAKVWSDSMDENFPKELEKSLLGRKMTLSDLQNLPPDILELLKEII